MADTAPAPVIDRKHIVDQLIEERAPLLAAQAHWPLVRAPLYRVLNYAKARRLADSIAELSGLEALEFVSAMLELRIDVRGGGHVPQRGPFLMLCNHPTGISDGIAAFDAFKALRPDLAIYANADALRVCRGFADILIPVEWRQNKRTRERTRLTLAMTAQAIEAGRPLIIFPAGRLARRSDDGALIDPEWMATAVSLARRYALPVAPVHIAGPHAFWFHLFDRVSAELRDITLFRELLNKRRQSYRLTCGPMIAPSALIGEPASAIRRLKYYIERTLPAAPDASFDPHGPECDWRAPEGAFQQG